MDRLSADLQRALTITVSTTRYSLRAVRKSLCGPDLKYLESVDYNVMKSTLSAYLELVANTASIRSGKRPTSFSERGFCEFCGDVFLFEAGRVAGCPWCHNRAKKLPVPRPVVTKCSDCERVRPIANGNTGYCDYYHDGSKGIWISTKSSNCDHFLESL